MSPFMKRMGSCAFLGNRDSPTIGMQFFVILKKSSMLGLRALKAGGSLCYDCFTKALINAMNT